MDDIAAAVIALDAWATVVPEPQPKPLPQMTNPIRRVRGSGDREFVLKQLPEYPPGVGPVDEFRVLCYLQEHGVPIALPLITDAGSIVHTFDGDRYTLIPYLQASSDNHESGLAGPETADTIGAAIGRLDKVLAACPWEVPSFVDDPGRQVLGDDLHTLPAVDVERVTPILDRLRAAVADLPTQRTHGDCNTGNVLVHKGKVTGFIDLDHLPISPRARDLSYYLASRVRLHLSNADSAERDLAAMIAVLGHYVAGYHRAHPLTEQELAAVIPMMLVSQIASAAWSLHGWTPNADDYRRSSEAIAWIVTHLEQLTIAAGAPPMSND